MFIPKGRMAAFAVTMRRPAPRAFYLTGGWDCANHLTEKMA
jgi:hypothetical protein